MSDTPRHRSVHKEILTIYQMATEEDFDEIRTGFDDLSDKEKYLVNMAKGRIFSGNFYKRWTDIKDDRQDSILC